jgi:phage major head subunit gpT-like protein
MITAQVLIDLNRQLFFNFNEGFQSESTQWQDKARKINVNTIEAAYAWYLDTPYMRKWIGDRVVRKLEGKAITVKSDPWELTLEMDKREVEYNLIGGYPDQMKAFGQAGAAWPDQLVTAVQMANPIWPGDGQNVYDTDHPVSLTNSSLGVYANDFTSMDLTGDNLWTIVLTQMAYRNDLGRNLELVPNILEVPTQLAKKGQAAIRDVNYIVAVRNAAGTDIVAAVATPAEGQQKIFDIKLKINPKLNDDPLHWYVHSTNRMMPFMIQVAKDPVTPIAYMDLKDPNVFWQRKYVWGTEAEGVAAPTLPFLTIRVKTTA